MWISNFDFFVEFYIFILALFKRFSLKYGKLNATPWKTLITFVRMPRALSLTSLNLTDAH